ncbi:MAG: hypothetical protein QG673_2034 [Pseudomonadota bacterium]|nr:hypothetical protein [Pseudomonadota bacterium]
MLYSRLMGYKHLQFIFGQQIVKLQLWLGVITSIIVVISTRDFNKTLSALLGAVLAVLPTLAYAFIAFRNGLIAHPKTVMWQHKKAMIVRFMANFVLFIIVCLSYKNCDFFILFVTYLITLSAYWLSLVKRSN